MVDGRTLHFHLAAINNQNFIMQDKETGSWWQQVSGKAIQGPLEGRQLEPVAWDELRFALWKQENPGGLVLRELEPLKKEYAPADWEKQILKKPTVTPVDPRDHLQPRDLIVGIQIGRYSKAYPMEILKKAHPIQDILGGVPILLVMETNGPSIRCFNRQVGNSLFDFYWKRGTNPLVLVDSQTGSEWDFSGTALSGPMKGRKLEQFQVLRDFWFDWKIYHPDTYVFNLRIKGKE